MELCAFGSLGFQIDDRKEKYPFDEVKHHRKLFHDLLVKVMIFDVASALVYLHAQGWVHLDMKPDNILLTQHGQFLLDLGYLEFSPSIGTEITDIDGLHAMS